MYHKDAFGRLFCKSFLQIFFANLFCNVALDKKISGGGRIKREFIKHEILKLHLKEKKYEDD